MAGQLVGSFVVLLIILTTTIEISHSADCLWASWFEHDNSCLWSDNQECKSFQLRSCSCSNILECGPKKESMKPYTTGYYFCSSSMCPYSSVYSNWTDWTEWTGVFLGCGLRREKIRKCQINRLYSNESPPNRTHECLFDNRTYEYSDEPCKPKKNYVMSTLKKIGFSITGISILISLLKLIFTCCCSDEDVDMNTSDPVEKDENLATTSMLTSPGQDDIEAKGSTDMNNASNIQEEIFDNVELEKSESENLSPPSYDQSLKL